jgi:hypothetical protein
MRTAERPFESCPVVREVVVREEHASRIIDGLIDEVTILCGECHVKTVGMSFGI